MSGEYHDLYDGSKFFTPLSEYFGLPIDMLNYLIAQTVALCIARLFRKTLKLASEEIRHAVCMVIGCSMGYFCFGRQSIHLLVLPTICYVVMRTMKSKFTANVVLIMSMLYLSCLHIHRQIYHNADYSLDITGPIMVITQRVTMIAYAIVEHQEVTENSKKCSMKELNDMTISKLPSVLEFFGYMLAFQTLLCGPVVFYADYVNFIKGTHYGGQQDTDLRTNEPSPRKVVAWKMTVSIVSALLFLKLSSLYPVDKLRDLMDPESELSRTWSVVYLFWFAYISTAVVRFKYYHAWLFADAISNNCGLGFNGYDSKGNAKWDKVSNIDILGFELSQNLRSAISCWNKNTNVWLRTVAYKPGMTGTLKVYALSALWHGFQPGYYLTFLTAGLFTIAARKVRATVRPKYIGSRWEFWYHVATFMTCRITMVYATIPFVLLDAASSFAFYKRLYFVFHLIALAIVLVPFNKRVTSSENGMKYAKGEKIIKTNGSISNGNIKHD